MHMPSLGDAAILADAVTRLGNSILSSAPARAYPILRRALELYESIGDVRGQARTYGNLGVAAQWESRLDEARRVATLFARFGLPVHLGQLVACTSRIGSNENVAHARSQGPHGIRRFRFSWYRPLAIDANDAMARDDDGGMVMSAGAGYSAYGTRLTDLSCYL